MLHVSKDNRNDNGLCLQDIYKLIGSSQLLIGNSKQKWSILVIPIFLLIAMPRLIDSFEYNFNSSKIYHEENRKVQKNYAFEYQHFTCQ